MAASKAKAAGDLGDLTPQAPAGADSDDILTFGWYGERIRVAQGQAALELVDFIEEFGSMDEDDPRALVAVKKFMRSIIHPVSFDSFWSLAKAHNLDFADMEHVLETIMELQAEHPTQPRSDSRPTRKRTSRKSARGSRSHKAPSDGEYARQIADLKAEGRADLAEFYEIAQRASRN